MFDVGSSTPPSSQSANSKERSNIIDNQSRFYQLKANSQQSDETLGLKAVHSHGTAQNELINIQENYANPEQSPQT